MAIRLSTLHQRLLLLGITLALLASAIGLSHVQERAYRSLLAEAGIQQVIIIHCGKIKQELASIKALLLPVETENIDGSERAIARTRNPGEGRPNLAVSFYVIQDNLAEIVRLQEESHEIGLVTAKAMRQLSELVSEQANISRMDEEVGAHYQRLHQGLVLSMDQLIGLHSLRYRDLLEQLDLQVRREPRFSLGFFALLVLVSFASSWWVVGVISAASKRQKQAQLERDRLMIELERKNAELERFVYTVSHDLRSPLITVKGFLGYLRRNAEEGNVEEVAGDIQRIGIATDTMSKLLDGLLRLSRLGRVIDPPEEGSLTELVREAAGLVQDQIDVRGVELIIDNDMPPFWGDRLRLREVFQNLIDNAVKYMGTQPNPRIEIGAQVHGNDIVCTVRDNGIGIDPRFQDKIFNMFERLDQTTEGTGIGLALVKRIVEAHGGSVSVGSEGEGQGTTFTIVLPGRSAEETSE